MSQDAATRARVQIVTADPPPPPAGAARDPGAPPPAPPVDALHGPGDEGAEIGGPLITDSDPEEIAAATGGGLAARVRARYDAMRATQEFSVPGWELPDGRPGLIVVARVFGDRRAFNAGLSNEAFIARCTHKLLYVSENGEREEITGGWGPTLAEMIGARVERASDLVLRVISRPDPERPGQRIPNVGGIGALATEILGWMRGAQQEAEEALGE